MICQIKVQKLTDKEKINKNNTQPKKTQQQQQTNKTINNKKDCRYKFILKYSQVKMTESHHNNYISQLFKITFFRKFLVIVFIYGYFQEKHV